MCCILQRKRGTIKILAKKSGFVLEREERWSPRWHRWVACEGHSAHAQRHWAAQSLPCLTREREGCSLPNRKSSGGAVMLLKAHLGNRAGRQVGQSCQISTAPPALLALLLLGGLHPSPSLPGQAWGTG